MDIHEVFGLLCESGAAADIHDENEQRIRADALYCCHWS